MFRRECSYLRSGWRRVCEWKDVPSTTKRKSAQRRGFLGGGKEEGDGKEGLTVGKGLGFRGKGGEGRGVSFLMLWSRFHIIGL